MVIAWVEAVVLRQVQEGSEVYQHHEAHHQEMEWEDSPPLEPSGIEIMLVGVVAAAASDLLRMIEDCQEE